MITSVALIGSGLVMIGYWTTIPGVASGLQFTIGMLGVVAVVSGGVQLTEALRRRRYARRAARRRGYLR